MHTDKLVKDMTDTEKQTYLAGLQEEARAPIEILIQNTKDLVLATDRWVFSPKGEIIECATPKYLGWKLERITTLHEGYQVICLEHHEPNGDHYINLSITVLSLHRLLNYNPTKTIES